MNNEININNKHNEFIVDIDCDEEIEDIILEIPVEEDPLLVMQTNNFLAELALLLVICNYKYR